MRPPASVSSLFRPICTSLSTLQRHRLLTVLGAVLTLGLGAAYDAVGPAVPLWTRLTVSGFLAGLFVASYVSAHIRRHFSAWLRAGLYGCLTWVTLTAAWRGFAGPHDMGLLLAYALLPCIVALSTRRMGPALRFLGVGLVLSLTGGLLGPAAPGTTGIVVLSLAAVALVEGLAIQPHLSGQRRLQGLVHSLPGVAFQARVRPDGTLDTKFVSAHAESLLGLSATPEHFFSRLIDHVPTSHRDAFRESLAAAVADASSWNHEVPFERPSGESLWLLCRSTPQTRNGESFISGVVLDVTERRNAERRLREERDRFEMLFESLPTPVVRCTLEEDGPQIADANGAFEEVFGLEVDNVQGQDVNDLLLASEDLPAAPQPPDTALNRRLLEEDAMQAEVRRAAAGGPRDFQLQAAGRTRANGPSELYAIYTDITEKKQYERELEKLTTRLQLALEATDTGFWEWDLETDTIFWDEACETLFGYAPGTFPGTRTAFADRVHPEDLSTIEQQMERAVDTGERYQADFRVQLPDGSERWIQSRGVVDYDETDTPRRMLGIQTDITARKKRECELRRKERRYQAIFKDPNILAGLLRSDGTLLDVNDTAMEYIDASRDAVEGRRFWDTPWWGSEMRTTIREKVERAANGRYVQFEADHTMPNGTTRAVTGVIRPVSTESGEVVSLVASARDITKRKRRARELLAAKEEAEEANRIKSAFLANMSHEIRTPLTSIIGFAEAIGDEVGADADGPVRRFAGLVEDSGRHLLNTLNAVLNLSKLEAGEMKMTLEPVSLKAQAESMADQLRPQADDANLTLHLDTDPAPAQADPGGLQVAVRNLLSNAIKYTDAGGAVWVRTRMVDGTPVLEVEDNGIGMNPEQVPTLFAPFRQASEGTSREYEGTGLGLAVTQRMIAEMDGTIDVDTKLGEGTCFTVRLPRSESPASAS